ncbi:hypothetical protein F8M41_014959 [Gigaspora margarita]|uniref:Uncharacterized protein n=1 Tax=Gigaspora margarita TaxID=4874 RepID=A0A8H3WVZ2_GIGMA|nr:hypothetical protein F8M41_014959 [Gigaspora margarita]
MCGFVCTLRNLILPSTIHNFVYFFFSQKNPSLSLKVEVRSPRKSATKCLSYNIRSLYQEKKTFKSIIIGIYAKNPSLSLEVEVRSPRKSATKCLSYDIRNLYQEKKTFKRLVFFSLEVSTVGNKVAPRLQQEQPQQQLPQQQEKKKEDLRTR